MGEWLLSEAVRTHTFFKPTALYGCSLWHSITSPLKITEQITMTNIMIMEKFKILWKLPKCDTKKHEVSKCCWKNDANCLMQCCHKPSICKNKTKQNKTTVSMMHNKAKCNETSHACMWCYKHTSVAKMKKTDNTKCWQGYGISVTSYNFFGKMFGSIY